MTIRKEFMRPEQPGDFRARAAGVSLSIEDGAVFIDL
jgi:hypothetical protein